MTRLFKRRSKKLGVPPGSLIYTGEQPKTPRLTLTIYETDSCIEKTPQSIEEAFASIPKDAKVWLQVSGVSDPHLIQVIGQHFNLHPLLLEDIMSLSQRAKLDDYKHHLFIVTRLLQWMNHDLFSIEDEQLSMVVGKGFLLTFLEKDSDTLNLIKERLRKPLSKMRSKNTDYLAYAILDANVDNYFLVLEKVDQELEKLEGHLLSNPQPQILQKIQQSKRGLALLRKTIWPMRELLSHFLRIDSPLISDATRLYAHDVYDHTIQIIETVEGFREITAGMLDIYISSINQRMNEIMKVLMAVATIFVPLTFITSLYGMNFDTMPGLHSPWGYYITLGFMLSISMGMLWFFRRRRWI